MNGAEMMEFSSRDFALVSDRLRPFLPDRLHHPCVVRKSDVKETDFSAERGHRVCVVDLPSFSISVTVGFLKPGQTTRSHRHNYETILFITDGCGSTQIEDRVIPWSRGDAIYIPVWSYHYHSNVSMSEECSYIACENAPLLQNLGGIALREEADLSEGR